MTFSQKQKKTLELLLKKYESSKTYNKNNEITQSFSILPEKIFPDYTNDFADVDKIHDFENDLEVLEKMELVAISKKDDRISKIAAISTDENWNKISNNVFKMLQKYGYDGFNTIMSSILNEK